MLSVRKTEPLQSLTIQFLQRCWVSGTPKGKGKTKDGQQLKRSNFKLAGKKGSKPDPDADAPKGKDSDLYAKCLNAPTPVRYLRPKERAREAEREKLGLISAGRKQEKENLEKGGRQAMGVPDEPMPMGTPGLDLITLGLVDAEKIPKYELTVEDGRRLAKEYSWVLMRKLRARQAAETNLLNLKKEAIEALPEKLKQAALVPDFTPFPVNRYMATLTPPIEGYMEKIMEAARQGTGKEKIR